MFSSSHTLTNTVEVREVERRSVSPTFNTLSSSQSISKDHSKIESNELNVNIPIKANPFSVCDNSSIYEWRKRQKAPIVRVIDVGQVNETNPLTGLSYLQKTIRAEPFVHTLKTYFSFTKEQMLLVFKRMLEGHQAIFKKLKATSICLEQCMITNSGDVRVWVNCRFQRNEIVGKIVKKEEEIVKGVFQDLMLLGCNNKNGKIQQFIEYVQSTLRRTKKWTFPSLIAMIKSYSDCLKLKIPNTISLLPKTSMTQNDPYQKLKFISGQPPKLKKQRHHNSFLCASSDRSAFKLGIGTLRRLSYNPKSGKKQIDWAALHELNFTRTATSKGITDKDAPTLRSLTIKSNHSSSVSNFNSSTARDCLSQRISQNSKQNLSIINDGQKRVRRISGVERILIHQIGIPILKQEKDEDRSSPSVKKSFGCWMSSSKRFNQIGCQLKVEESISKAQRKSQISTTNQTLNSAQLWFNKKQKQNQSTIVQQTNQTSNQHTIHLNLVTASKDRFWANKNTFQQTQTINSCTNWSNRQTLNNLNTNLSNHQMIKEVQASTILQVKHQPISNSPFLSSNNLNIIHSNTSSNSQKHSLNALNLTPQQSRKQTFKETERNPKKLLADLAVEEQAESFYHTQKNSSSCSRSSSPKLMSKRINFEDRVIELISLNKNLAKSTYMETNSQRKIFDSPRLQGRRRLKEIEETLEYIIKANVKQQKIIEQNCWTKKIDNLLGPGNQSLRQSIVLDGTGKGFKEVDSPRYCNEEVQFGSKAAFNIL